MRYQNLVFFNKLGEYCDFVYDETYEKWVGTLYFPRVSCDLFETQQLFIAEKFLNTSNELEYGYPHMNDTGATTEQWETNWVTDEHEKIFLFTYDVQDSVPFLTKHDILEIDVNAYADTIDVPSGLKVSSDIVKNVVQLNFSISSDEEDIYERDFILRDSYDGQIILEIHFYGETIGEDERLKVHTDNLGYSINKEDTFIFRDIDINEIVSDNLKINEKRKEILREGSLIKPYTGSYKALINAIKFYGYDNLKVKEYWRNVDINSSEYGKYKHSTVLNIFNKNENLNDTSFQMPNTKYRKTSLFGLYYRINDVVKDQFDKYDLPVVEELFEFTLEEALIKLYGLKNKLKAEYLPLNARIIDIVGEADYFNMTSVNMFTTLNHTDVIDCGINPDFEVLPSRYGFIEDLRNIEELGLVNNLSPVPHNILLDNTTYTVEDVRDFLLAYFTNYYPNLNTLEELADMEGIPTGYPIILKNTSFDLTWDEMEVTWNTLNTGVNHVFEFRPANISIGDIFIITDTISGESIQHVATTTSAQDVTDALKVLWDAETGSPWHIFHTFSVLSGSSYVLRIKGVGSGAVSLDFDYVPSTINGGGLNTQTFVKEVVTLTGLYTWDSVERSNFYEIEWIVTKVKTDTPAWRHEVRGTVATYEQYPLALPYAGTYTVEMRLYDTYNQISQEIKYDYIEVESKQVEFIGVYKMREKVYTWDSVVYSWNSMSSSWNLPLHSNVTWDDLTANFYDGMDRANSILPGIYSNDQNLQIQTRNDLDEIVFTGPYTWDNMDSGTWDDCYHLWWDGCDISADTRAHFVITSISASGELIIDDGVTINNFLFTTTDLELEASALNASTDPVISRYVYNIVYDNLLVPQYIQAVGKLFGKHCDFVEVTGSNITLGNIYNSRTTNLTFDELNVLKDCKVFPKFIHITFIYDKSRIPGKRNPRWRITNTTNPEVVDVTYNNKYLNYMFKYSGDYTIELTICDTFGNQSTISKNLVKIV